MGIMGAMAQGYHYDVNYDDKVTITDAILIVNKILGKANAGEVEGLQEVDLGLPSGTKWASINVGASSPTDIGTYRVAVIVGRPDYSLPLRAPATPRPSRVLLSTIRVVWQLSSLVCQARSLKASDRRL